MPQYHIDSLDDERLDIYRDLKATKLTRWSGQFIAEGKRLVRRLLHSDFDVQSVLVSDRQLAPLEADLPADRPVYVVAQSEIKRLVGYNFHTGALACGVRKPSPDLAAIAGDTSKSLTLVVCPNVIDQENLGTIIRVATAFGADAVLLGRGCADPFSRRALRVSMGGSLMLPIVETDDLDRDLGRLAGEWNVELAATVLDEQAEPLETATRSCRFALLFGNETDGLDANCVEQCHRRLTIPMQLGTDSLNVGVAAGICLYHFQGKRQK